MPRTRPRPCTLAPTLSVMLVAACYAGTPGGDGTTGMTGGLTTLTAAATEVTTSMSSGTGDGITTGSPTSVTGPTSAATDATMGETVGVTGGETGATEPVTSMTSMTTGAADTSETGIGETGQTDTGDPSTGDPSGEPGPSCGQLAAMLGWGDDALCEQNGDGICDGTGQPTWDCELCCDASALPTSGFGYPVGDLTTYPAGGWSIGQVLSHYYEVYGGRHLAHDVNHPQGGVATIDAPVHSVADGVVRYAGPNTSLYKHVVLIEHPVEGEDPVCSFYGHINAPVVTTGQMVKRGQQITSVMNWDLIENGAGNTHLHYGIIRKSLCDASAAAKGALICGYDEAGDNNVVDLASEPYSYQPVADLCGNAKYGDVYISPTKFIEAHHF